MTAFELPPAVRAVLAARLQGVQRRTLAQHAQRISDAYRSGQPSSRVIAAAEDALAYALVRMPATYAAVRAALVAATPHMPALAIESVVDIGAGPGTATLAALGEWPGVARVTVIEPNQPLAALAHAMLAPAGVPTTIENTDATRRVDARGDLALSSYVQVELTVHARGVLVRNVLGAARSVAVFVEPGTPAGYDCIRAAREVIAQHGWHIAAPCPHAAACQLTAPDWCHFKVRLPRSRDHKQVKQSDVPFEDEPFAYVVATRAVPQPAPARVLRPASVTKAAVDLVLCAVDGKAEQRVERVDPRYKAARKAEPGDPCSP